METTKLFCLAWVLAWISGVLFGMGLERKLFERKNSMICAETHEATGRRGRDEAHRGDDS
jgi:hypothetical protein